MAKPVGHLWVRTGDTFVAVRSVRFQGMSSSRISPVSVWECRLCKTEVHGVLPVDGVESDACRLAQVGGVLES